MSLSNKRKERKECKKQEKNRLLKEQTLSPRKHVKVLKNTTVLQNFVNLQASTRKTSIPSARICESASSHFGRLVVYHR